ncbi:MAG: SGNH/GDSL hydrolase family protein [Lachnospiraceae bacterium]|nr:SGNH/GDSL hydrolase family protein [Lachnospiraceae bacterium]
MKQKAITVTKVLVSVLIIGSSLYFLQKLLLPKYANEIVEGAMIAEYYQEEKDHDVVFIGDCEVYENFSPQVLWDEFGINSYIRGSAQQLIWQSYYILEDTLRYETPKVVIFNVQSMQFDKPDKEAYNRMTIDGMEWSWAKLGSIKASMTDKESFLDYLFPILRYHSRWSEVSAEDAEYMFQVPEVSHNGYYMRVDTRAAEDVPAGKPLANYRFGEIDYKYLDKLTKLCKINNIELVLIKAPSLYPYWYDQWEKQIEEYAEKNDLLYVNFLEHADQIGLDFAQDTYDGGLHMNLSGAEKITKYFGEILMKETEAPDRRSEEDLASAWDEKRKRYIADREEQYEALREAEKDGQAEEIFAAEKMEEKEDVVETAVLEESSEKDAKYKGYAFVYKDTVIEIDALANPILKQLGEANAYFEAASCAFNGLDKMYTYSSFELDTYPMEDKDYVSMVLFKDDAIATAEGVSIGDSVDKVREIYGRDCEDENGMMVYEKDGMKLCFIVQDESVTSIEYQTTVLDE